MSIILTLEQKTVEDIVAVLKRLPFQPHFLIHIEEQLESQLVSKAKQEVPAVPEVIPAPIAEPVVETLLAEDAPVDMSAAS
jgi:hypothetical protein